MARPAGGSIADGRKRNKEQQMSLTMPVAQRVESSTGDWSIATRAAQFVAVFLQVLVVGAFWGSWIGLSRFMDTLTPATFVEVGHAMMEGYGPIMSVLMPATLLATLAAGILVYRRNRLAGLLTLAGFVCVAVATATTLIVNVPIDEMMAGWTVSTLPADWTQIRDRWEWYHTARTFVTLGGLAATLAGSLLPAGRAEA
jgi:hypothetical protein